jgi:hypothetical protein
MCTTPPPPPPAPRDHRGRAVPLAATALAAAGAAALLAGCASSTNTAGTSPGAGAATSAPHTQAPVPVKTRTPAGASSGLAMCQSSSLRVAVNGGAAGGAAGSIYYPVNFTNISGSPCQMFGYPGVSFVTGDSGAGQQIGAAAQENPTYAKQPVRLAAGGVAHAWLQVTEAGNYPSSTCEPVTAHWLRVFAPGNTAALYVSHSFDACSSANAPLLTVMPVRGGQGVQGTTP